MLKGNPDKYRDKYSFRISIKNNITCIYIKNHKHFLFIQE